MKKETEKINVTCRHINNGVSFFLYLATILNSELFTWLGFQNTYFAFSYRNFIWLHGQCIKETSKFVPYFTKD